MSWQYRLGYDDQMRKILPSADWCALDDQALGGILRDLDALASDRAWSLLMAAAIQGRLWALRQGISSLGLNALLAYRERCIAEIRDELRSREASRYHAA